MTMCDRVGGSKHTFLVSLNYAMAPCWKFIYYKLSPASRHLNTTEITVCTADFIF